MGDRVSSDRGNTTAPSPTCQHASGQGRADRCGELPCDDTVTEAAQLASAEGNHLSDDRCPSPRRCPSPCETRAETDDNRATVAVTEVEGDFCSQLRCFSDWPARPGGGRG
ncbi:hypothetical protein ACOMHN_048762 [Nucella lapillus]